MKTFRLPLAGQAGAALLAFGLSLLLGPAGSALAYSGAGASVDAPFGVGQFAWRLAQPTVFPPARAFGGAAYDAATRSIVLIGGQTLSGPGVVCFPGTWTWNGATWTAQNPANSPSASEACTADVAYDAANQTVVLLADDQTTWSWNGTTWTLRASAGGPATPLDSALAYDATTGYVLALDADGTTWVWDGTSWTERFPATTPDHTNGGSLAFDAANQTLLYFAVDGTTWTWDGTNWTEQYSEISPSWRQYATMVYDDTRHTVILFGGLGQSANALADTWSWNGKTWSRLSTPLAPSARYASAGGFDAATGTFVLFSGTSTHIAPADTWVGK
jgi:hypothetical protein